MSLNAATCYQFGMYKYSDVAMMIYIINMNLTSYPHHDLINNQSLQLLVVKFVTEMHHCTRVGNIDHTS